MNTKTTNINLYSSISLDPKNKAHYAARLKSFEGRLKGRIAAWKRALAPHRSTKVVVYHRSWIYFNGFAGFREAGYIEPKVGIPPSPSSVAALIRRTKAMGVRLVFSEAYYPSRTAKLVASRIGATYLALPTMVGARPGLRSYIQVMDAIVADITSALRPRAERTR